MRVAISHAVTRDVTLRNTPWNTVYLSRVVDQLRADGHDLTNEVLRHVSPQIWEQINPIGIYDWSGRSKLPTGTFRPLGVPRPTFLAA